MNQSPPARAVPSSRSVRMRDVADLAGVGTMTVSRVLNGSARVSQETSARVYRAIEQLQYRPNQVARALRGSRSHTIGVLLPYLYDPFFAACAQTISDVAQRHAYSVLLSTTNESPAAEVEAVRQMARHQVDGLIIIPGEGDGSTPSPEYGDLPIVTLDRPMPLSRFDTVGVENDSAGSLVVQHLLGHGHRRIAFISLPQHATIRDRYQGYAAAMRAAGLSPECCDVKSQDEMTGLLGAWKAAWDRPTALFTSNGLTTHYALRALAELGLEIPGDMAIVGFDDFELADLLRPALTVVRQPVRELAQTAAEMLFAKLGGAEPVDGADPVKEQQRIVLPVTLVIRGSCGC